MAPFDSLLRSIERAGGGEKVVLASHYAFYISIENTIAEDYVTEKFYQVRAGFGSLNPSLAWSESRKSAAPHRTHCP